MEGADLGSLLAAGHSGQIPAAEPGGSSAPSAGSRTSGSPQLAGQLLGHWDTSQWSSAKSVSKHLTCTVEAHKYLCNKTYLLLIKCHLVRQAGGLTDDPKR